MKSFNPFMFVGWIILIHSFLATLYGVTASTRPKQPHIIVIMADDLGWNDVSYHGSNQIPTPNIDALAYNGVILQNYYAQPVCTPSRGSFLTGQYAIRTGLQGAPLSAGETVALPLNFTLLPEHLRNLGYATNLIGKWHVGYYAKEFLPTFRGFDRFYGYYNGYIKYFSYILENISNHFPGYDLHHDTDKNLTVDWTPKRVYATDLFTNEAENVIGNHDPKIPLYLQFSHLAPHTSGFAGDLEVRNISQVNETFHYVTNDRRRLYAGMVSALDESTGRVVKALEKKGMLSDSMIIFVSDNGAMTRGSQPNEGSNFPYRGQKFSLYEGGVHVPALVWSPIIQNTSRIHKHYFHVTDWLPTLYKLAGGNIDDLGPIDGIDQSDSIINNGPSPRDAILLNIDEVKNTSGAIKGPFKYVAGVPIADGFYMGENVDDGDSSAPPYNLTSVMKSVASLAISSINNDSTLSEDKILQLRRASKIVCARQTDQLPLDCTNSCLFNVLTDPCEALDVSEQNPTVVEEFIKTVQNYRKVLLAQPKRGVDPRSLPDYEGGPWLPWLTVDGEPLPRPLSTNSIRHLNRTETVGSAKTGNSICEI